MSARLPSGSTTSNDSVPRRLMADITANERPSNGCRSRRIVTDREMSWRWVVCGNFLRQHRLGVIDASGASSYRLRMGAALHRKMAEGTCEHAGWRAGQPRERDPARGSRQPNLGKPFPALCVRSLDERK